MAASADNPLQSSGAWLQRGQALEAEGRLDEAVAAYDHAIAIVRLTGTRNDPPACHALGLAWMNRGNALQKLSPGAPGSGDRTRPDALRDAVAAYDEAIALFRTLPIETEPALRNHLGAAWLNRGHAHIGAGDFDSAAGCFEHAIAELAQLPIATDPYFRLNLAGAHTNLAHATFESAPKRAAASARSALAVLAEVERAHEAFAGLSLRARRALVMALGVQLHHGTGGVAPTVSDSHGRDIPAATRASLVSEATDTIDDGLAIARDLETHGISHHRPLACRLFRLGVQLYGTHQPHFLGEFVLETLAMPAFANDDEFRDIADAALAEALIDVQRPHTFMAGTPETEKRVATARSVREAQQQLALSSLRT